MKNNRFIENLDIKLRIFKKTERKNLLQRDKNIFGSGSGFKTTYFEKSNNENGV